MGFFSKTCAKTHLPVITQYKDGFNEFKNVVALFPDGTTRAGIYDGYGRVDGESVFGDEYEEDKWESVKFVLKKHYNGEKYSELGKSGDELAQGYFMDNAFLVYCVTMKPDGFKSYAEYKKAVKKYAGWI
jgi:hypothetical protein